MKLNPLLLAALAVITPFAAQADDLRLGIIGSDTSHVPAFTRLLNDPTNPKHIEGAKVVALFKSFSPDIAHSAAHKEDYAKELQEKWGVRIESSIESLAASVDAVLIESVDGRPHLEQAKAVIAAHKPLFIDKPVAGSLKDAIEIFRLAKEANVPVFTSSSYRFYDSLKEVQKLDVGEIRSVISYGPAHLEPTHPDLFWYAIHPTEALFTILGKGCESVTRTQTESCEVVTGVWKDGRIGILHGLRKGPTIHRVMVFGTKMLAEQKVASDDYAPLVREIVTFFQTGVSPVSAEDTLDMFAFMEAADESKRQGGRPVTLAEVLATASK
ncbi:MAG: Gfo/Idh/MocA family oxidoreductase [Verrucomicrobiota bacterium]